MAATTVEAEPSIGQTQIESSKWPTTKAGSSFRDLRGLW